MLKRLLSALIIAFTGITLSASDIRLADPTIFYEDGVYYLTGTGDTANGFTMYMSADLIHWTPCGNASGGRALYKGDTFGTDMFWAPQIFKYGNDYYMAYAANEQIAIAKGSSPEGPFRQTVKQKLNGTTGQIDPFVFIDDDGTKYIYYVRFINGNSIYVGKLADDFQSIDESSIKHCVSAEDNTWEMSPNAPIARVDEGPTVIKDGGYYYLIYSANHYQNIDYSVGYAYSTSPTGPWKKVRTPFISRHNTGINGSGHGDMFRTDDGQWYYVFHVHASNTAVHTRRTALVPITMTDNPEHKFIPEVDRMIILNDAAGINDQMPEPLTTFEADGVAYTMIRNTTRYVAVTYKDPVAFGGYEGEVTIPASVDYGGQTYTVNSIGTSAFYNCPELTKVSMPASIMKIGIGSFENCGISSIDIPETVMSIGYRAFADSKSLLDVVVNRTRANNLLDGTFSAETLAKGKLWVPQGTSETYKGAPEWGDFTNISGILTGTPLYDFEVDGVYYDIISDTEKTCQVATATTQYAAYRGPLVTVPPTVEHDGTTYTVTAMARMAMRDSRLVETVTLPEGMTMLATYAMSGMTGIKSVVLPSTLTSVGVYCFKDCSSLNTVTSLAATPPAVSSVATFPTTAYEGTLYVPKGSREAYAASTVWGRFAQIIEMEDTGIETIGSDNANHDSVYTLQGVRVSPGAALNRGIYIVGGRKIMVK